MKRLKLDKIDKNILKILQNHGRLSNVDLAKSVGISAPPCLRRVRALKDSGYIKGYYANIDHEKLGYQHRVFAFVTLTQNDEETLAKFESYVMGIDFVRECHAISGQADFILKIVAKNQTHYEEFVQHEIKKSAYVRQIDSSVALKPVKNLPGVPIE